MNLLNKNDIEYFDFVNILKKSRAIKKYSEELKIEVDNYFNELDLENVPQTYSGLFDDYNTIYVGKAKFIDNELMIKNKKIIYYNSIGSMKIDLSLLKSSFYKRNNLYFNKDTLKNINKIKILLINCLNELNTLYKENHNLFSDYRYKKIIDKFSEQINYLLYNLVDYLSRCVYKNNNKIYTEKDKEENIEKINKKLNKLDKLIKKELDD